MAMTINKRLIPQHFEMTERELIQKYNTSLKFERILDYLDTSTWTETSLIYPEISQIFTHFKVVQKQDSLTIFLYTNNLAVGTFFPIDLALFYIASLNQFKHIVIITDDC